MSYSEKAIMFSRAATRRSALLTLVVGLMAACSSMGKEPDTDASIDAVEVDAEVDAATQGTECSEDSDCFGALCDDGFCVQCRTRADCGGQPCSQQGQCFECLAHGDCVAGEFCVANECVACSDDTHCSPETPYCESGSCVACRDDTSCPVDLPYCVQGVCDDCSGSGACRSEQLAANPHYRICNAFAKAGPRVADNEILKACSASPILAPAMFVLTSGGEHWSAHELDPCDLIAAYGGTLRDCITQLGISRCDPLQAYLDPDLATDCPCDRDHVCVQGKCIEPTPLRGPSILCQQHIDCDRGLFCNGGRCTADVAIRTAGVLEACRTVDGRPDVKAECAPGLACVDGICKPLPDVGASCADTNACLRGACVEGACVDLAEGSGCRFDVQGAARTEDFGDPCGASLSCDPLSLVCRREGDVGSDCRDDEQCRQPELSCMSGTCALRACRF